MYAILIAMAICLSAKSYQVVTDQNGFKREVGLIRKNLNAKLMRPPVPPYGQCKDRCCATIILEWLSSFRQERKTEHTLQTLGTMLQDIAVDHTEIIPFELLRHGKTYSLEILLILRQ